MDYLYSMDEKLIARIICDLEEQADGENALLKALTYLLAILQEPTAYTNTKLYPFLEYKDLIHWVLLSVPAVSKNFKNSNRFQLSNSVFANRKLAQDGKFKINIEGLFTTKPKPEYVSYEFDVCISFAGEQRAIAEEIAKKLKEDYHLSVFYDDYEKLKFWGENHFNYLYEVYSQKSMFCLMLLSEEYLQKNWTNHELKAVQSRVLKERRPYVLPIKLDANVAMPIEFENIGWLDYRSEDLEAFCSQINDKVWAIKQNHWLMADEMAEIFNKGFLFRLFFEPFKEEIAKLKIAEEQLFHLFLGIAWAYPHDKVIKPIHTLIEFLLFGFDPIAAKFDENNVVTIINSTAQIRREVYGGNNGHLIMKQEFWEPIQKQWRIDYPDMFRQSEKE